MFYLFIYFFNVYWFFRYLSYVMDVATPTADCLNVVYDLLSPVIKKGKMNGTLSVQEVRIIHFMFINY